MKDYTPVLIRFDTNEYRQLRKLAFLKKVSMAELVRQGTGKMIKEYKEVLTNSDIVLS